MSNRSMGGLHACSTAHADVNAVLRCLFVCVYHQHQVHETLNSKIVRRRWSTAAWVLHLLPPQASGAPRHALVVLQ